AYCNLYELQTSNVSSKQSCRYSWHPAASMLRRISHRIKHDNAQTSSSSSSAACQAQLAAEPCNFARFTFSDKNHIAYTASEHVIYVAYASGKQIQQHNLFSISLLLTCICNLASIFFGISIFDLCKLQLVHATARLVHANFYKIFSCYVFALCCVLCAAQLLELKHAYQTKT